jgi:isoleucyl-tRNA synthetase
MTNRNYSVSYLSTEEDGSVHQWNSYHSFQTIEDMTDNLKTDYQQQYKDDPNYKLINITKHTSDDIDWELQDRMRGIRSICELGHRVRAETKLKNRQPLSKAYVLFSDPQIQNYMIYVDCGKNEYANIVGEELNVDEVIFIENTDAFTDLNLKPNFRTLGPKGFGKQAQGLKKALTSLSMIERKELFNKLSLKEAITVSEIPLSLDDLEIEYLSKPGFSSASDKCGVIILDTSLNENLTNRCFVGDVKSAIQNVRKNSKFEMTDRVFVEIFCSAARANLIDQHRNSLKNTLLAVDIKFFPPEEVNKETAQLINVDGEDLYVNLWKDGE